MLEYKLLRIQQTSQVKLVFWQINLTIWPKLRA